MVLGGDARGVTHLSWIDLFAIGIAVELAGTWLALAIVSVNRGEEPRFGSECEDMPERRS